MSDRQRAGSLGSVLALNRAVGVVLVSVLFFGLGEQLWSPFLPVYLQARVNANGAAATHDVSLLALLAIGIYACLRNLFEAACFVGGGELTARLGDRGSLILFGVLTLSGYVLFLTWTAPAAAILATLLILGWEPLSVPVTFTTVGATVTRAVKGWRSRCSRSRNDCRGSSGLPSPGSFSRRPPATAAMRKAVTSTGCAGS